MVSYEFNVTIDRFAIADEAISSCGNILIAAGFDPAEIQSLFLQAANQLASGEAISVEPEAEAAGPRDKTMVDADDIRSAFEELPAIQALEKLKTRAEALDRPSDGKEVLAKCLSLVFKMIPLIEEAQNWIRAEAEIIGVLVEPFKAEWIERASDDELDDSRSIIFLDDFDISYRLNWDFIEDVARYLVDYGDNDSFNDFFVEIMSRNITPTQEIVVTIENGRNFFKLEGEFRRYVLNQKEEILETSFLDEFARTHDFPQPSYLFINSLKRMEEAGEIERYTRGNRKRVRII